MTSKSGLLMSGLVVSILFAPTPAAAQTWSQPATSGALPNSSEGFKTTNKSSVEGRT